LGRSWGGLGASWCGLGVSWGGLGASWGILGSPGSILGRSWGGLGSSCGHLGVQKTIKRSKKAAKSTQNVRESSPHVARFPFLLGQVQFRPATLLFRVILPRCDCLVCFLLLYSRPKIQEREPSRRVTSWTALYSLYLKSPLFLTLCSCGHEAQRCPQECPERPQEDPKRPRDSKKSKKGSKM
jgi:hypothetical protein